MTILWLLFCIIGGVLALVLAAVLGFAVYLYYQRSKYSHLPSPKLPHGVTGFFLGHYFYILKNRKDASHDESPAIDVYQQWYYELGGPGAMVVHFMNFSFVILCHPENIKEVVMQIKNGKPKRFSVRAGRVFGERFIGNGLALIPDHDTWRPRRKTYEQPFHKSYLKSLLPSFNECTDKLLDDIRPLADGKTTVYIKRHLSEVTMDVISKVAFGSDFAEQLNTKTLKLKWAKENGNLLAFLLTHSLKGMQKSFREYNMLYQYFHPFEAESYRETVRALRMIGRDCIMKRIKAIEAGEQVPQDILTAILQTASSREVVSIEDLVDDFVNFYGAGQETTGTLLSFVMVLIHQHPEVLCRLQTEVEEVLGGRTEVTNQDLDKLQYTELFKVAMKDGVQLPVGDHFVPEGSMVLVMASLMGRMPQYFDSPETFNPSRFNPENKLPSSFVYFPFGVGHRSCIGKHFAMMETKVILARLVQTFSFTLPPDYKLVVAQRMTSQPKDDVPCTVTLTNQLN